MTETRLNEILTAHKKWLDGKPDGVRADLSGADLRGANLSGAKLRDADLSDACLRGTKNVPFIPLVCPEVGSYIGFKKVRGNYIVVLEIQADAARSSATTRKCRASKAIVLRIENLDGTIADVEEVYSLHDKNFCYQCGETVAVDDFNPDRWIECAPGIHHFISRQEAVNY